MNAVAFQSRLRTICSEVLPAPASGRTQERLQRLMAMGREDLSLAKLAEAHWDAVAILGEAGQAPVDGAIYAVWASEIPGRALTVECDGTAWRLTGSKPFCSGAGLVDQALVTAGNQLLLVDLHSERKGIAIDGTAWKTDAFRATCTSTVSFDRVLAKPVCEPGWYVDRPGFWHGACGVAACWAGGASGLLDWAMHSGRNDPHTLAHFGALHADLWATEACLAAAAREIDAAPTNRAAAQVRALTLRHLIEQACTNMLLHFGRAFGPHPLAMDEDASRRVQELQLYLRQSHAERDLEALGRALRP